MAEPEISVVMPTGGRRDLRRPLDALARALAAQPGEVVVAIDAAAPPEAAAAIERDVAARGHRSVRATVPGASATRNAGWRATSGALLLFVDDDVLLDPPALGAHVDAHRDGDPALATIGRLRWPPWRRTTPFERWVDDALQFGFHEIAADGRTGWWHLFTCDCAIRRAPLEAIGGLDEQRFPFGYEDLDLGLRLDREVGGLRVRLLPDGGAIHDTRMTLTEWRRRILRIARAERSWQQAHPDVATVLGPRFERVGRDPTPRSGPLAGRLARWLPEATPAAGPWLHERARVWWEHDLAARFRAEAARLAAEEGAP
ncbi:glycosyltransferase family 2 protein [Patulibacter defluvii]|uniref:glycosyltransferase family 2 protein n=1 Tax=Patulibacter defluvii TaxID=3095358 RepID=UPI002A75404E|nr:glycosyltransferase [Patulibacter sp. DM4]